MIGLGRIWFLNFDRSSTFGRMRELPGGALLRAGSEHVAGGDHIGSAAG